MQRNARASIDLAALRHNLARVRDAAPRSRVMAAVKAEAYGHGMLRIAEALADADGFAVACLDEALALRDAGIEKPILVLQGAQSEAQLEAAATHEVSLCIHHQQQLRQLETARLSRPVSVWLKIDSGMHRLGVAPGEAPSIHAALAASANVKGTPALMTHFARADERDADATPAQIKTFDDAITGLAGEQSLANSAAILAWPHSHRDWVRPGSILDGSSPFVNGDATQDGLKPVMTLRAPLIAIRQMKKGDAIGYGASWTCPEDMPIGCIAIGYGDGYPRHAPSGTPVLINGQRAPLAGRVSMDLLTVDLRGIAAKVGDSVTLWGRGLSVDEIARHAGTISYELTCSVGPNVHIEVEAGI